MLMKLHLTGYKKNYKALIFSNNYCPKLKHVQVPLDIETDEQKITQKTGQLADTITPSI